jgi:hypothetical protein
MPPVKGSPSVMYPLGVKPNPPPQGLAVGRLAGSSAKVPWKRLPSFTNYDILRYELR